jgi:hypothetical protein
MPEPVHKTDRDAGHELLVWPINQPMIFYTVASTDATPGGSPFVRDFHAATALALKLSSQHGGEWCAHEWEWDPRHDETTYVRKIMHPVGGKARLAKA